MITAAIEAAIKPMRNKLEATIMFMQRIIESFAGRVRCAKGIPGKRQRRNDGIAGAAGCQTKKRDGSHADPCNKITDCFAGITFAGAAILGEVRLAGLVAFYKRCAFDV